MITVMSVSFLLQSSYRLFYASTEHYSIPVPSLCTVEPWTRQHLDISSFSSASVWVFSEGKFCSHRLVPFYIKDTRQWIGSRWTRKENGLEFLYLDLSHCCKIWAHKEINSWCVYFPGYAEICSVFFPLKPWTWLHMVPLFTCKIM